jgi:hypothetical protein
VALARIRRVPPCAAAGCQAPARGRHPSARLELCGIAKISVCSRHSACVGELFPVQCAFARCCLHLLLSSNHIHTNIITKIRSVN